MKKKRVILNCSGTYIFDEIYKPIINRNCENWEITVLLPDTLVPDYLLESLKSQQRDKIIHSFYLYPTLEKANNVYRITERTFQALRGLYDKSEVLTAISTIKYKTFNSKYEFLSVIKETVSDEDYPVLSNLLKKHSKKTFFRSHKEVSILVSELARQSWDMIVSNYDHGFIDQYLIDLARSKKAFSVTLCPYTFSYVTQSYFESDPVAAKEYFDFFPSKWPIRLEDREGYSKKKLFVEKYGKSLLYKKIVPFWRLIKALKRFKDEFFREYLYHLLFLKKILLMTHLNRICFASGQSDFTICYDILEINALKAIVKPMNKVLIAQHPSAELCSCASGEKTARKLLVIFGNYSDSGFRNHKLEKWVDTIQRLLEFAEIDEVDLRLHPRSLPSLSWPEMIIQSCKKNGCKVNVMRGLDVSIASIACDYVGVLGSPSASLRVLRFACPNLFVIAITNCGGGNKGNHTYLTDQIWSLGYAEGIKRVPEDRPIEMEHTYVPKLNYLSRPHTSEVLNNIMQKSN